MNVRRNICRHCRVGGGRHTKDCINFGEVKNSLACGHTHKKSVSSNTQHREVKNIKIKDFYKVQALREHMNVLKSFIKNGKQENGINFNRWDVEEKFFKKVKQAATDMVKEIKEDLKALGVEP